MAFMVPEYNEGKYHAIETDNGTCFVPADVCGDAPSLEDVRDYVDGTPVSLETRTGVLYRLTAPGYMDCTDWTPADSLEAARKGILEDFDVCPACGEDVDYSSLHCDGCGESLPLEDGDEDTDEDGPIA